MSLGLTTASTIDLSARASTLVRRSPRRGAPSSRPTSGVCGPRPVQKAIDMFKQEPTLLRKHRHHLRVDDTVSGAPYESLRSQLLESGITVVSVAIDNRVSTAAC